MILHVGFVPILFAVGALFPAYGDDASTPKIQAEIQNVLIQRHPVDTDSWWRSLGPDAPGVIIGMYQQTTNSLHKIHLLQGLSVFQDDPMAAQFLEAQTKSDTSVIRNAALGALASCEGEKAIDTLADALKNDDPQTRFAAAKALHRLGGARAAAVLDPYLKSEKVQWISARVLAEAPAPGGLKPMAAPEVPPQAEDYAGEWRGFWIEPGADKKKALVSLPSKASLRLVGPGPGKGKLEGEISTSGKQFKLTPAEPQSGLWKLTQTVPAKGPPVPRECKAELSRSNSTGAVRFVLVLKIPALGVTAVLSRDPG